MESTLQTKKYGAFTTKGKLPLVQDCKAVKSKQKMSRSHLRRQKFKNQQPQSTDTLVADKRRMGAKAEEVEAEEAKTSVNELELAMSIEYSGNHETSHHNFLEQ